MLFKHFKSQIWFQTTFFYLLTIFCNSWYFFSVFKMQFTKFQSTKFLFIFCFRLESLYSFVLFGIVGKVLSQHTFKLSVYYRRDTANHRGDFTLSAFLKHWYKKRNQIKTESVYKQTSKSVYCPVVNNRTGSERQI